MSHDAQHEPDENSTSVNKKSLVSIVPIWATFCSLCVASPDDDRTSASSGGAVSRCGDWHGGGGGGGCSCCAGGHFALVIVGGGLLLSLAIAAPRFRAICCPWKILQWECCVIV